jgi:hypothetical protein
MESMHKPHRSLTRKFLARILAEVGSSTHHSDCFRSFIQNLMPPRKECVDIFVENTHGVDVLNQKSSDMHHFVLNISWYIYVKDIFPTFVQGYRGVPSTPLSPCADIVEIVV